MHAARADDTVFATGAYSADMRMEVSSCENDGGVCKVTSTASSRTIYHYVSVESASGSVYVEIYRPKYEPAVIYSGSVFVQSGRRAEAI